MKDSCYGIVILQIVVALYMLAAEIRSLKNILLFLYICSSKLTLSHDCFFTTKTRSLCRDIYAYQNQCTSIQKSIINKNKQDFKYLPHCQLQQQSRDCVCIVFFVFSFHFLSYERYNEKFENTIVTKFNRFSCDPEFSKTDKTFLKQFPENNCLKKFSSKNTF